jgi:1,4-dihydroxy-2-naphthoate octaprenyltransferase
MMVANEYSSTKNRENDSTYSSCSYQVPSGWFARLYFWCIAFRRVSLGGLSVFCAQFVVSYSNDYFDYSVDRFTTPTLIAGGSGVLRCYPELRPMTIRVAMILTSVSFILMILVTVMYDLSLFFASLVGIGNLIGWCYSAPPIRLVDRGFGEFTVAGITGFMLPAAGYLSATTSFSQLFALFLVPALMYGMVFILLVEIPDMEADRKGKKRTVITRWGQQWGFYLTFLCLAVNLGYFLWLRTLPLSVFPLDLTVIAGLSAIPLIVMIFSYLVPGTYRQSSTARAIQGIISLISYLVLMNIYLLYSL